MDIKHDGGCDTFPQSKQPAKKALESGARGWWGGGDVSFPIKRRSEEEWSRLISGLTSRTTRENTATNYYIPLIACCTKCTGPVLYRCLFKLFIGSQCLFNLLIGFGVCALPIGSQCLFTHMQITIPQSKC